MSTYQYEDRDTYLRNQIDRSRQKSGYCKVYFADVLRYRNYLLQADKSAEILPILCLGVRNGAEVDIFRAVFNGPLLRNRWIQRHVASHDKTSFGGEKTRLARAWGVGSGNAEDGQVVGVELTPEQARPDVWIGSFDELPAEWTGRFGLIYSNSFDHSQDPERTVAEWKRVARPGAFAIMAFAEEWEPNPQDPLGHLTFERIQGFWNSPVAFMKESENKAGYKEICFQL